MASIKLKNVSKRFALGPTVIHDFNLEADDAELIVLLGPSGSGKTTLLRMIAGLESVSAGEIYIGDKLVNDVLPKDRDIGMIFQNHPLYAHMNIYENMAMALYAKKLDKKDLDRQINEMAKNLEIENLLALTPKKLTRGDTQRVVIARTLLRNPRLFLMDEPLQDLDASLRIQLRNEIVKYKELLQTTMLYVTHDQRDAMAIASRIVVMRDGHIEQIDTPQELYFRPANQFVAGFIGYPQMNFMTGVCVFRGNDLDISFQQIHFSMPEHKTRQLRRNATAYKKLILGIRPEHIYPVDNSYMHSSNVFLCPIHSIEPSGAEAYVKTHFAGFPIIAKMSATQSLRVGDAAYFYFDLQYAHLFDLESGKVVSD